MIGSGDHSGNGRARVNGTALDKLHHEAVEDLYGKGKAPDAEVVSWEQGEDANALSWDDGEEIDAVITEGIADAVADVSTLCRRRLRHTAEGCADVILFDREWLRDSARFAARGLLCPIALSNEIQKHAAMAVQNRRLAEAHLANAELQARVDALEDLVGL